MATTMNRSGRRLLRIAIVYDNTARPDTTGEYCRRALEELGHAASHFLPGEVDQIAPIYDLYLRVDDDLDLTLPRGLRPLAYWALDTHRDYGRRLLRAREAEFAFCAQRNAARRMRTEGVERAFWLPLACEPAVHRRIPGVAKQYDLCFVGNTFPGDGQRTPLVEWIRQSVPRAFIGNAYGEEMARTYTAARLVFNCAIRDDVNMRVFEAAACGSLLLTNDLADNGQDLLFTPGQHLVTYRTAEELAALIPNHLAQEAERERIAEAGMRHAHAHHTYRHRMEDLLAVVFQGADLEAKYPVECGVPRIERGEPS